MCGDEEQTKRSTTYDALFLNHMACTFDQCRYTTLPHKLAVVAEVLTSCCDL